MCLKYVHIQNSKTKNSITTSMTFFNSLFREKGREGFTSHLSSYITVRVIIIVGTLRDERVSSLFFIKLQIVYDRVVTFLTVKGQSTT